MSLASFRVLSSVENLQWKNRRGRKALAADSRKEEKKTTKRLKLVSLRVPGTHESEAFKTIPGVLPVNQEPQKKRIIRKTLNQLTLVTVPVMSKQDTSEGNLKTRQKSKTPRTVCIPTIKRCSREEIRAINREYGLRLEKINRRNRKSESKAEGWGTVQRNDKKGNTHLPKTCTRMAIPTRIRDIARFCITVQ